MSASDYHFITQWRVPGTVEQVSDVLGDPLDLVNWWPAVYLSVIETAPGDAQGVGRVVCLHTRGWLPYTLRWNFRVVESRRPHGFSLEAWGDLDGAGIWTFSQDGDSVNITYDWRIRAEKPLLRYLSFLLKPIFSANHRWAMAEGEKALRIKLSNCCY